ncbi:repetitive organellar protein isoform X1 [Bombyx mori]|uniref:Uncharacterized protein n=1 Tax=Bombyx mori TaxID=7091 RepID=A0A8R2HS37_BOMMO|nr:uncharacterized protein PFB0145c [Bombyx mori]
MSARVLLLTALLVIDKVTAHYLQAEPNYLKPKLERNNVVNKGVWIRKDFDRNLYGKASLTDFIFRPNSLENDAEHLDFDAFNQNSMQDVPFFTTYIERTKRSPEYLRKRHPRKSLKDCVNKKDCRTKKNSEDKSVVVESMFISDVKPNSIFKEYPHEVALLLNDNNKLGDLNIKTLNSTNNNQSDNKKENSDAKLDDDNKSPKKREDNDYVIKSSNDLFENNGDVNPRGEYNKYAYETDGSWIQNAPITKNDRYSVIPKEKPKFTEKGLVKVISMLTKTFKKIMKQHNDIKIIHQKLNNLNDDFLKNVEDITNKFREFDTKFTYLTKFNEKLKNFETNQSKKDADHETRAREIKNKLDEFAEHQTKFLTQQKQFYSLQKLILAQNEKITTRQNNIAKTQAEISQRQNNFARILLKAKQLIVDSKKPTITPINTNNPNTTNESTTSKVDIVKINLLNIPAFRKIINTDDFLIKEKHNPIDELVYKYYFNNTFIDNIMKTKILAATLDRDVRQNKTKRNNDLSTILLPVKQGEVVRDKRWIQEPKNGVIKMAKLAKAPFVNLATKFCNQIGQNGDEINLKWCIEKVLRRLQHIDTKVLIGPVKSTAKENAIQIDRSNDKSGRVAKDFPSTVTETTSTTKRLMETTQTSPTQMQNFPDNEELESNLKKYDLKPDLEGNVYFDGSVHTSQIVSSKESEGFSDIMPGLESNSRVEMDPVAFGIQANRRQYVKRFNNNLLKRLKIGI